MTSKIFLHIGGAKTGSTALQRNFFATHPKVAYFGEEGDGVDCHKDRAHLESMIFMDDLFYSHDDVSRIFREKRAAMLDDQVLIYSNADIMTSRYQTACAHRLFEHLPDAEVIIVIRNQFSALKSYWANHGAFLKPAPGRHFRRYVPFTEWLTWGLDFFKTSPLANFLYWEQVNLYSSLWGKNKLHVLLYEDLIAKKGLMFESFARILGVDCADQYILMESLRERQRKSKREMCFYEFASRYFNVGMLNKEWLNTTFFGRRFVSWLEEGVPANPDLPLELFDRVSKIYAESNTRLASDWGLNLTAHDYPIKLL
jgi:hypothetical protein